MKRLDTAVTVLSFALILASTVLTAAVLLRATRRAWPQPEPAGDPDPAAYHVAHVLQEARDITEQAARP